MTGRIEPSSLRAYNFSHRWRGEARLGSIRTGSSLRLRFTGQCWPLANAGGDRRWGVRWTWPSSLTWSSKPQSAREAVHTWTSEFEQRSQACEACVTESSGLLRPFYMYYRFSHSMPPLMDIRTLLNSVVITNPAPKPPDKKWSLFTTV